MPSCSRWDCLGWRRPPASDPRGDQQCGKDPPHLQRYRPRSLRWANNRVAHTPPDRGQVTGDEQHCTDEENSEQISPAKCPPETKRTAESGRTIRAVMISTTISHCNRARPNSSMCSLPQLGRSALTEDTRSRPCLLRQTDLGPVQSQLA